MACAEIEALLKQAMGLDAATIGEGGVERAVRARMAACRVPDVPSYISRLHESPAERQALIEVIVVPETWFFRDRNAYTALVHIAREKRMPARAHSVVRVLSVPCSTGEEPYSIAMTLADAGFSPACYSIDAADISFRAIEFATQALYGRNSFRSSDLGFRNRHFEASERGYRLRADVRAQVRFHQGNLLADDFPFRGERYDAVFCRNVLIYFDRRTQDKAIRVLDGLLVSNGTLFVGSSETGLLLDHGFDPAKLPLAFAFHKPGAAGARQPGCAIEAHAKLPPPTRPKPVAARKAVRNGMLPDTRVRDLAVTLQQPEPVSTLEKALLLADRGSFADAARLCEQHLRKHGPAAGAFYLLGLVREAAGESHDAEALYRKALYLDPNHQETLAHLALLRAKQGDETGARLLRERIGRLQRSEGR